MLVYSAACCNKSWLRAHMNNTDGAFVMFANDENSAKHNWEEFTSAPLQVLSSGGSPGLASCN
jgi:hypothetical protein